MSNQTNSFSSPLNDEVVKNIDLLNLTIVQKHHLRILAHCLEIFKEIAIDEKYSFQENELLREWCYEQSQKFKDENFNKLFYEQMSSAAKKLNSFSQSQGKTLRELDLKDLIILISENSDNIY